jgi:surface-anchored protein
MLVFGHWAHALNPEIIFEGEEGDLTFFYNSAANTWVTVFRDQGADATGLTTSFSLSSSPSTWTGIVGNTATDFLFSRLATEVNTRAQATVGTTSFYLSPADGSPLFAGPGADLGIRTRLRENEVAMNIGSGTAANQFTSFNLTLDPAASTFNGSPLDGSGAFVSLLHWSGNDPVALINTDGGPLTANFGNYGHVHRNWGFSQYGDYDLVFQIEGVGGTYGDTAATGLTTIGFAVAVPEPGTLGLAGLGMVGAVAGFRWLRCRRQPEAITEGGLREA